jgi:nucleotide-binding universal stress UspA family protein
MAAQPKRIVVGFDGSEGACRALDSAAQHMGYGSTMTVVSVVQATASAPAQRDPLDAARDLLLAQLITARYERRFGDPADEIVGVATEVGADVVIVGRRGPGESNGSAPGSVSAEVVRRAHCDVLVVG